MVLWKMLNITSTQPYLGECLYENLASLRCDMVTSKKVGNNLLYSLTMVRVCLKAFSCLAVAWSLGVSCEQPTLQFYLGERLYIQSPCIAYCIAQRCHAYWGLNLRTNSFQSYLGWGLNKSLVRLAMTWSPGKKFITISSYSLTLARVCTNTLYRSAVTWSPGKKVSTASHRTYLGEGLYKGLVSLRGDVVPGENVEYNIHPALPW
jgi:hypothetical protein